MSEQPCPRCGEPMTTVLFGLEGDPFCVACLEPEDEYGAAAAGGGE